MDAAWDELEAVGYRQLTMAGIAERAGTSRAVLYRRWRNLPELVIAALRRRRPMLSGEVPDTGSLRGDVLALLRRASGGLAEVGPEINGLLGDSFADAGLFASLQDQVLRIGAEVMATISNAPRIGAKPAPISVRGSPGCQSTCSATSFSSLAPAVRGGHGRDRG